MAVSLICHRYLLHRLSNLHLSLNLAQFCFASISEIKKKLVSNPTTFGKFVIQYKALQMTIASTYATGAILLERCGGFLQRLVA